MKHELNGVKTRLGGVETAVGRLEGAVGGLANRVGGLEATTSKLEATTSKLEATTSKLEATTSKLEATTSRLETGINELREIVRRIWIELTGTRGELREFKETAAATMATKSDIRRLEGQIDGLAKTVEDGRFRWAVHADRLADHEKRLRKLEARRA